MGLADVWWQGGLREDTKTIRKCKCSFDSQLQPICWSLNPSVSEIGSIAREKSVKSDFSSDKMNAKDAAVVNSDEEERRKQVTVFQHPDVPFLKISINSSGRVSQSSSGTENERERGGERTSCRTSLRRPTSTAPKSGGLSVPREVKARSLSPARDRPGLPTGRQNAREEVDAAKPKRSFIDTGSAKLFEKAADLKSSLDSPHYRVPSMRDEYQESVSLPSSPMNSRKIGLSYMTPPTTRKFGSSVSPIIPSKHDEANSKPPKLAQNLIRTEARSSAPVQPIPTPFTFHLRGPDQPSSSPSSRSSSPAPFTSMLKSPTPVAESSVSQRVSRFDTASRSDQLTPGSGTESDVKKRGVSPTPLGNLRLASSRPHGETAGRNDSPSCSTVCITWAASEEFIQEHKCLGRVPFLAVATYTRLNLAALRLPKSVC